MAVNVQATEQRMNVGVVGAELSGSLWMPVGGSKSIVLMIPGSGRSTRDCDGYFDDIRAHLLQLGFGVAAFDKRGSGRSTGSFYETSIENQVDDACRCLAALRSKVPGCAIGVFGHSQGGWVAFELAAIAASAPTDHRVAFAVSNSGPAVGPAAQERDRLRPDGGDRVQAAFDTTFDELVEAANLMAPYTHAAAAIRESDFEPVLADYLVEGPSGWKLLRSLFNYDPTEALGTAAVPVLVIHGRNDQMVPVQESLNALDQHGVDAIRVEVIEGVNHRLLDEQGSLPPRYFDLITGFLADHA